MVDTKRKSFKVNKSKGSTRTTAATATGSGLAFPGGKPQLSVPGTHELDWQCSGAGCTPWTATNTITVTIVNPAALVVSFPEPNYAGWTNRYYEMVLNQDPT